MSKRPVGKPKKFQCIRVFKKNIADYFQDCDNRKAPYTVTGLAQALGTSRQLLCDIEQLGHYDDEYLDAIKKAKAKCELWLEENMLLGKASTAAAIFSLKNNYGWVDKQEREISGGMNTSQLVEERRQKAIAAKTKQIEHIEAEIVND